MSIKMLRPGTRHCNKVYYARIAAKRKRVEISCRSANPRLARRFAEDVERRLFERGVTGGKTVGEAIDAYIVFRRPTRRDEDRLLAIKDLIGERMLEDIVQADFDECARILCPGLSNDTRNRDVYTPLQAAVRHSGKHVPLKRPKLKKPKHRSLSSQQRDIFLKNATDKDLKAFLCLMFFTGCRASEAARLKWEDVDLENAMVRFDMTKTGEEKWCPLHQRAVAALGNLPKDRNKVFRWQTRSGPNRHIRKLVKLTGIKFNPHMARHTFADLFMERGGSLRDLMEAGRWSTPSSAMRYTGKKMERVRKGIAKL